MTFIEVDPAMLGVVGERLVESVRIAGNVKEHHNRMAGHARNAGHPLVTDALGHFLSAWSYGCGCLVDDGNQMAERLDEASRVYLAVEEGIAKGFPQ